ncbi:hypothetical protein MRX96_028840 [Rhipicephalus microplus]
MSVTGFTRRERGLFVALRNSPIWPAKPSHRLRGAGSLNCADCGVEETLSHLIYYLAEWETFTRTLLTVHRCIWCLSLLILDVPQPRGHFFWGLRLHNGCATIVIEVSALEDPWRDFMLPCLQYTCRLRNPQWTSLHYFDSLFPLPPLIAYRINAAVTQGAELLEFHDTRIARILESTMDMPSLRNIEIYLGNDNGGPSGTTGGLAKVDTPGLLGTSEAHVRGRWRSSKRHELRKPR